MACTGWCARSLQTFSGPEKQWQGLRLRQQRKRNSRHVLPWARGPCWRRCTNRSTRFNSCAPSRWPWKRASATCRPYGAHQVRLALQVRAAILGGQAPLVARAYQVSLVRKVTRGRQVSVGLVLRVSWAFQDMRARTAKTGIPVQWVHPGRLVLLVTLECQGLQGQSGKVVRALLGFKAHRGGLASLARNLDHQGRQARAVMKGSRASKGVGARMVEMVGLVLRAWQARFLGTATKTCKLAGHQASATGIERLEFTSEFDARD